MEIGVVEPFGFQNTVVGIPQDGHGQRLGEIIIIGIHTGFLRYCCCVHGREVVYDVSPFLSHCLGKGMNFLNEIRCKNLRVKGNALVLLIKPWQDIPVSSGTVKIPVAVEGIPDVNVCGFRLSKNGVAQLFSCKSGKGSGDGFQTGRFQPRQHGKMPVTGLQNALPVGVAGQRLSILLRAENDQIPLLDAVLSPIQHGDGSKLGIETIVHHRPAGEQLLQQFAVQRKRDAASANQDDAPSLRSGQPVLLFGHFSQIGLAVLLRQQEAQQKQGQGECTHTQEQIHNSALSHGCLPQNRK